jgi:hypothetical protein
MEVPMTTNTYISAMVSMMVNAVIFGVGAIAVLTIPPLTENAWIWLPVVVVISFVVAPFIARRIAPKMRSRWERRRQQRTQPIAGQTQY